MIAEYLLKGLKNLCILMMKNGLYIYGGGSFDFKIDTMYYVCKVTTFDLCYHLYKYLGRW